ncbi:hypothetical protein C427_3852 [Paraglaciecola psychrophila 170]|uniref:Uncharacterized protein n=1 Tax=Paraglaciecola psychrophila 170 TaxID=1129794 RepID=K7AXI9_9ALTE|nr:hypothetical protein C427_3852 [Paraglaciecola psychrophila 170]GAC39810.1 hypothetical protein GPSY_4199 [Paraglaciecola psychrophila 170]
MPALAQVPGDLEIYRIPKFLLDYYSINQKTMSVGWRWDFD